MKYKMISFFQVLVSVLLLGCYQMDKKEQLNTDSRINYDDLAYYVDSVLNRDLVIPDSIKGILYGYDNLQPFERVIYFDSEPKEYFLVNFFGKPIVIESVLNESLSNYAIYRKEDLSEDQIAKIEKKFRVEILDKVVAYANNKSHKKDVDKTPDSLDKIKTE